MDAPPLYEHRQVGWAMLGCSLVPLVFLFAILRTTDVVERPLPPGLLPPIFAVACLTVAGFSTLQVVVTRHHLRLRFGPGLYRRTVALDDIAAVEPARSRWYEGLGVHATWHGMLYNVASGAAVRVVLASGRSFRIGSDDADRLRSAIARARDERRRARR